MSLHIANGMFGAVVIDPPDLAPVDRSTCSCSRSCTSAPRARPSIPKVRAGNPTWWCSTVTRTSTTTARCRAEVGERVRIWVLDAGPNRGSAFHVVGAQFDTVYREGAYDLRPGPA